MNDEKNIKVIFAMFNILFVMMLIAPLIMTNLKDGKVSIEENRMLADKPTIYTSEGGVNYRFISDLECWFNDNIGLRSQIVKMNARIQYYLFDRLPDNTDLYLGPNGELNYATTDMIASFAHVDLLSDEQLASIADSYQFVNDHLEEQGILFYYFQCWDKHSVYPEYFMDGVHQYGNISMTDQVIEELLNNTDVAVISPKEMLINEKDEHDTYSFWGDATQWTQRGAYLSYLMLMDEINEGSCGKYKVLQEKDYDIGITDQGSTISGGIHVIDMEEDFEIAAPKAYQTDEAPIYLSQWQSKSRTIYQNDSVDNDDTIVILGDSYFDSFLIDDIAESFAKTVLIWGDYTENIPEIIDHYKPVIVVCENAERCNRFGAMEALAKKLKEEER